MPEHKASKTSMHSSFLFMTQTAGQKQQLLTKHGLFMQPMTSFVSMESKEKDDQLAEDLSSSPEFHKLESAIERLSFKLGAEKMDAVLRHVYIKNRKRSDSDSSQDSAQQSPPGSPGKAIRPKSPRP